MLDESPALARILDSVAVLSESSVALSEAMGRFVARPLWASIPLPGFDNSAMDGYALRAEDTKPGQPLRVMDEQSAGLAKPLQLLPGCAVRIFTGAPMPQGTDAVIMQEDVERQGDAILCKEPVVRGENVRRTGVDLCAGQQLLKPGDQLTPARLALLASQGLVTVAAIRTPRVAIVTTGDELVPPGQALLPGQLYNSNGLLLQTLTQQLGIDSVTLCHLPDDREMTIRQLQALTAGHDFIVLSGGVSVGDHDHVKPALQALGITPQLWRVRIKPGKPLLHAISSTSDGGFCHIFGLPGNPVSSFVTWQVFVRPALLKAMGAAPSALLLPVTTASLAQALENPGDRPHYVRGILQQQEFLPVGLQQSHALFGLSQANALLRMEPGQSLKAGTGVTVFTT